MNDCPARETHAKTIRLVDVGQHSREWLEVRLDPGGALVIAACRQPGQKGLAVRGREVLQPVAPCDAFGQIGAEVRDRPGLGRSQHADKG